MTCWVVHTERKRTSSKKMSQPWNHHLPCRTSTLFFWLSPLICVNKPANVGKAHCTEPVFGTGCLETSQYLWIRSCIHHSTALQRQTNSMVNKCSWTSQQTPLLHDNLMKPDTLGVSSSSFQEKPRATLCMCFLFPIYMNHITRAHSLWYAAIFTSC